MARDRLEQLQEKRFPQDAMLRLIKDVRKNMFSILQRQDTPLDLDPVVDAIDKLNRSVTRSDRDVLEKILKSLESLPRTPPKHVDVLRELKALSKAIAGISFEGQAPGGSVTGAGFFQEHTGVVRNYATGASIVPIGGFANVAASQTDSSLVALTAGRLIRVFQLGAVAGATATTLVFNSKGGGAGTAISPTFANAATGGEILPYSPLGWFDTNVGEALTATTGAGATTGILFKYAKL